MAERLKHFLLIYDGRRGELRSVRTFARPAPAVAAYQEAEREFRAEDGVQVVLVASDSIATVRKTHSNFWSGEPIETLLRVALGSST